MKKILFMLLSFLFLPILTNALTLPVEITADSAIVANINEEEILYEKEPDKVQIMASLTKIMTAYTVINRVENLDETITITEADLYNLYGFTCAGLKVGDIVTYRDLLYGMMLVSGADASQALANHMAGSNEEFKKLMNEDAKKLGMNNSNFEDTYGRSDDNLSTAREMYILLKEALKNKTFKEIFTTTKYTMTNGLETQNYTKSQAEFHGLDTNMIKGNKSGYTPEAGLLLASITTINGEDYIIITCKSEINTWYSTHILDTYKIYDYLSENNYEKRLLLEKGNVIKKIEVDNSTVSEYVVTVDKDITKILSDTEFEKITYDYHIANIITTDNKKGDTLGYIDILVGEEVVATYNVYLKDNIYKYQEQSKTMIVLMIVLVFLIIIILCTNIISNKKHKKKR